MARKFPTYCSPEQISEMMDLMGPEDNYDSKQFSDISHPKQDSVVRMILAAEDEIDRNLRNTWRENRVEEECTSIHNHWHDINGLRMDYRDNGGDYIQLRHNLLPIDPDEGDYIKMRTRNNIWYNVTPSYSDSPSGVADTTNAGPGDVDGIANTFVSFWIDRPKGRLFLRHSAFQPLNDAIKISYRYGYKVPKLYEKDETDEYVLDEEGNKIVIGTDFESPQYQVPEGIQRMCACKVAIKILNQNPQLFRPGEGGDVGSAKQEMINGWKEEINEYTMAFRRAGAVRSLYR